MSDENSVLGNENNVEAHDDTGITSVTDGNLSVETGEKAVQEIASSPPASDRRRQFRRLLALAGLGITGVLLSRENMFLAQVRGANGDIVHVGDNLTGTTSTTITNNSQNNIAITGTESGGGIEATGVAGNSINGNGVKGYSGGSFGAAGVYGTADGPNGTGVAGFATYPSQGLATGVYGESDAPGGQAVVGYAGNPGAIPIVAAAYNGGGQTANLQEWRPSYNGAALSVVDKNGHLGIGTGSPNQALDVTGNGRFSTGLISPVLKPNSDSTTALQLQTATGTNILNVDTTNSRVGIGTTSPKAQLHVSGAATADVFCGLGPHPEYGSGPAMNYGYSGHSLGEGSGFFNVRPDASAVAPNPSLRFMTVDIQRMIITNTGNVGIGTSSPAYKLDVAGPVHATSFPTSSDMRFKEDITPIDNALDKVLQLQGVYFKWNQLHRETLKRSSTLTSRQVGLIAQQVREVLPEVVSEWADQGADDYLAVDYSRLVAITIEAMKELATRNSEQQTQVSEQQSTIQQLLERIAALEQKMKPPSAN